MKTKDILRNAFFLCLLSVIGMFSFPISNTIKISLQILVIFIIFGLQNTLLDRFIVVFSYLLLGLIFPIYAGFQSAITPTFGYVIGFVLSSVAFSVFYNIKIKNDCIKFACSSIVSLLVIYLSGILFMMFYLSISLKDALIIGVLPYFLPDLIKITIAWFTLKSLQNIKK